MPNERIASIPDTWSVWAFSDPHGVTSAFVSALQQAGLIDAEGHWSAPPETALIGCGDYLDRGGDVGGLVRLLRQLEGEASAAGGAVALARGNHEAMPLMVRAGGHGCLEMWLEFGGAATLEAYSCDAEAAADAARMTETLEACAPGLFEWLESLHQAVRWRDVLFVHGGLPPRHALDDLGVTTEEHLWIRAGYYEADWASAEFDAYRRDGVDRVVFGHTPQPDGPTMFHEGRSLDIDTNAVGNPRMPEDAVQELTLLGLSGSGSFEDATFVRVPTRGAADTMRR